MNTCGHHSSVPRSGNSPPGNANRATARKASGLLGVAVLVVSLIGSTPRPARAEGPTKPVGINITRVQCTGCDAEGIEAAGESKPDFYAKVFFDGREHRTPRAEDDQDDIRPTDWLVVENLHLSETHLNVAIQIWDHDEFSGDDLADATPRRGDRGSNLEFRIDLASGDYTGDITSPQGCATGNGDGDGDVTVCFEVVFSANGNLDGDGLSDGQEIRGIDFDLDGTVDFRPAGASYRHRDLYVEADWVEHPNGTGPPTSFAPDPNAIPDVVAAFAAAPLANPDGTTGVTLHVDFDEPISMTTRAIIFETRGATGTDDFLDFKLDRDNGPNSCRGTFGTAAERLGTDKDKCVKVLAAKKLAYRYVWFADQQAEDMAASGRSEGDQLTGGNDFMVTLGNWTADGIAAGGGQRLVEAGVFMHEFGHTLGLAHGGRTATVLDGMNCKPNYFSVMNFLLTTNARFNGTGYVRPLDYSRGALPDLDERALDEGLGLRGPPGQYTGFSLPDGKLKKAPSTGAIDWNGSASPANPGGIDQGTVSANINNMPEVGPDCGSTKLETIAGRDDWANLHYPVKDSPHFADGPGQPADRDGLTAAAVIQMAAPDVRTALTGPVDVTAGGPVAVTASATNAGPGEARQVALTISQPGPTASTAQVGPLAPRAAASRAQAVTVPCTAADGTTLVSTASVVATGALGQEDLNPANDTASLTTTVHKPVPQLSLAAAPSGLAGEAVPVTVTYRNAGSAPATGVTARVVLPQDVYYAPRLDPTGSPRPSTVTRRADGTTELGWTLPDLAVNAAAGTITFRVRPSLLMAPGTQVTFAGSLTTNAANGCPALVTAHSTSTIVTVPATAGTPVSTPVRSLTTASWTAETLSRIQATDQRFDGAANTAPDGGLDTAETRSIYGLNLSIQLQLRAELLTTYFNLAERRFNNDTTLRLQVISPILTTPTTAGEAAHQAQQLLDAPSFDPIAAAKLLVVLVPLNSGLLT